MAVYVRNYPFCDFKNILAFGHNELWLSLNVNSLYLPLRIFLAFGCNKLWYSLYINSSFVTLKTLWPVSIMIIGSLWS